jgi:hypothetical protein
MTYRTTVAGRAAGALVVLAALPGLAACTPADLPMTAVRAAAGGPVVLLASCADFEIDRVSVYTSSRDVTASVDGPGWEAERTGGGVPDAMPLLGEPPAGWKVVDDSLAALTPDQPYGLSANDNGRRTVPITFTDADLAALGPGEVLVGKTPSSHEKVTEQEFRKRAKDAC